MTPSYISPHPYLWHKYYINSGIIKPFIFIFVKDLR